MQFVLQIAHLLAQCVAKSRERMPFLQGDIALGIRPLDGEAEFVDEAVADGSTPQAAAGVGQ